MELLTALVSKTHTLVFVRYNNRQTLNPAFSLLLCFYLMLIIQEHIDFTSFAMKFFLYQTQSQAN